jgi:uncharacterized protein (DUF1684 family)
MVRCHRASSALIALVTVAMLFSCLAPPPAIAGDKEEQAYVQEIEAWHQGRIDRLTAPDGYLSMAGLFPIDEGANRFGSAASNAMVFPEKAPKQMGTLYYKNDKLEIAAMPGVTITHNGEPVDKMYIQSDRDGEPTVLESGTFHFYVIERRGELYMRVKDAESALRESFAGVERFPVDPKYRIEARFEPYNPPKPIIIADVLGHETTQECPGAIVFELDGRTCRLEPTLSTSGDEFFIVFGDETSGLETYGGGRFLYTRVQDEDGKVVLDFNKAYNPPCAFTPYSTCPLPHRENILPVRIEAGEKAWSNQVRH